MWLDETPRVAKKHHTVAIKHKARVLEAPRSVLERLKRVLIASESVLRAFLKCLKRVVAFNTIVTVKLQ